MGSHRPRCNLAGDPALSQAAGPRTQIRHGKVEALTALAQSTFIVGSAVLLLFEAGARALDPRPIEKGGIGIAVMLM